MSKRMYIQNRVAGDRVCMDDRLSAMRDEQVAATNHGERDVCPKCHEVAVAYQYEEDDLFLAQCEKCGMMGG